MLKRTKKFIVIAVMLYLLLITWQIFTGIKDSQGILPRGNKLSDVSVKLFFGLQPNGSYENVVISVLMMALAATIGAGIFIYLKNSNMFSAVQQRIGYKSFIKKGVVITFLAGTALSLLTNLYQLGLINWFYYPFVFKKLPKMEAFGYRPGYFSTNELFDLCVYIILAAIGWGVFAVLTFSIGLFVQRSAFYLALGPITGLALILLATLGNLHNAVWRAFAFSWFFYTLTAPGQYTFVSQAPPTSSSFAFVVAVIIYLAVAACLISFWHRRKRRLGKL